MIKHPGSVPGARSDHYWAGRPDEPCLEYTLSTMTDLFVIPFLIKKKESFFFPSGNCKFGHTCLLPLVFPRWEWWVPLGRWGRSSAPGVLVALNAILLSNHHVLGMTVACHLQSVYSTSWALFLQRWGAELWSRGLKWILYRNVLVTYRGRDC